MHKLKNNARYVRQLPLIGSEGQNILFKSKVLIVGVGGLGCPLSLYLSQAGVGNFTLIDNDSIDTSNLHRQILFTEEKIGFSKALSAKEELNKRNSETNITVINARLNEDNALDLINKSDVVIDCSDNYDTRYLLNKVCRKLKTPLISASIFMDEAYVTTLNYAEGPCLECIFPEKPPLNLIPNCSESGVLGIDVGIVGLLQSKEVINVLLGRPKLHGKIMNINLESFRITTRVISKSPKCSIHHCTDKAAAEFKVNNICIKSFKDKFQHIADIQLIDVRNPEEHNMNNIGGTNIPLNELPEKLSILNKNKSIMVYCGTGKRSQEAACFLAQNGFNQVFNIKDGINK